VAAGDERAAVISRRIRATRMDVTEAQRHIEDWAAWRAGVRETWPQRWKRWRWYACLLLPPKIANKWMWRR